MQFKMEKAIMNRCMNGWGMKKCSWFRKASSEGRKERSLPFYRPNHTSSLLWGWSLEEGKKQCLDLAESLCLVSFHFVEKGPGCQSIKDGWTPEMDRVGKQWLCSSLDQDVCCLEVHQRERRGRFCLWVT